MKKFILLFMVFVMMGFHSFSKWTWQNPLPQGNYLFSVYFSDVGTGYAVGLGGTILKTTNGGYSASIEETSFAKSKCIVYPNPASIKITLKTYSNLSKESFISIFNMNGEQIIYQKFQTQNQLELDLSTLAAGIYLLKIQTNEGIEIKKPVIR